MQFLKVQESRAVRRGQSLIGILVSVFVMIGLTVFFLMPRGGNDGTPEKARSQKAA